MTYNERISQAYYRGTRKELVEIQIELLNSRQKIGEFLDRFLDDYDTQMSAAPSNDLTWKLYRQKHRDYGVVEQCLRNLTYFMNKL